jgi:hypothetical protein
MGNAKYFDFENCECEGVSGVKIQIPTGRWPVTELDVVSIYVDNKTLEISNVTFQLLKLDRKAIAA